MMDSVAVGAALDSLRGQFESLHTAFSAMQP